jgi:nucleotide-binding universal stress UspA family protein
MHDAGAACFPGVRGRPPSTPAQRAQGALEGATPGAPRSSAALRTIGGAPFRDLPRAGEVRNGRWQKPWARRNLFLEVVLMQRILAAIDFSGATDAVMEQAAQLALAFRVPITLLHVVEPEPDFVGFEPGPEVVRQAVARDFVAERKRLHQLRDALELRLGGVECAALQVQGPSASKILEEAERLRAGMIVLGSHGHGALYHLLVGSVAESVLRKSSVPVVVVPAPRT